MIVVNFIILVIFIVLIVKTRNYEREFVRRLDSDIYKMKQLFPTGLYILDRLEKFKRKINFTKQEESLKAVYVGESIHTVKRIYMCNKVVIFILTIFVFNLLSIFSYINVVTNSGLQNGNSIFRQGSSSQMNTISLDVYMKEEDVLILTKEIDLEIQGRKYTDEELSQVIIEAKTYIDSTLLKENNSLDEIMSDINLVTYMPQAELFIDWKIEDYELISRDGKISNLDLNDKVKTQLTAIITYYELEFEYTIDLTILPKVFSKEEIAYKRLLEEIEEADIDSSSEEILELPTNVDNMEVSWDENKENSSLSFLIMGVIVAVIIFFSYDNDLYEKVEERNQQILLDYPEIINKITLLLGAGMPLKNAWHKIVEDYKSKDIKKRYAYEEMIITSNELLLGISEITAYESFGRRIKLLPYLRFSSLIAQNVKKGSGDLLRILEVEAIESFEERKELAKRIGEKAGTRLLFPMMLMLLIVLVIVIVPAFLSFQV